MEEGLWHDLRRGYYNAKECISLSFLQGLMETWLKNGKVDQRAFNSIKAFSDELFALLHKNDYTDEDAAKANALIRRLNAYIDKKQAELEAAEAAGKEQEYMIAHSSGIDDI